MTIRIDRIQELRRMAVSIRDNPLLDAQGRPIKFDMADWYSAHECGTTACLAGHMPFWPAFQKDDWKHEHGAPCLFDADVPRSSRTYFGTDDVFFSVFVGHYYDSDNASGGEDPSVKCLNDVTIDEVIARIDEILARHTVEA
jgi:hypothetical protein